VSADPATIAWYTANAARYTPGFDRTPSRELDPFLDRLKPGARVLELGCGGGRDSARIAERGFALDATDGTAAMVDATRSVAGVPARHMAFDQLVAVDAYDAVWAQACLIHVPRQSFADVVGRIRAAMRPEGWHFASFKLGSSEGRDGFGRLHNFPTKDWLEAAYRAGGFDIKDSVVFAGQGADGVQRDWLALTVRKPN
jgi:SAM-dependent methyltransferase